MVIISILNQYHLWLLQVQALAYCWHYSCSVLPPRPAGPCCKSPALPSAPAGTFGGSFWLHMSYLEPGLPHWKVNSPPETGSEQRIAPHRPVANVARMLGGHESSSTSLPELGFSSENIVWSNTGYYSAVRCYFELCGFHSSQKSVQQTTI